MHIIRHDQTGIEIVLYCYNKIVHEQAYIHFGCLILDWKIVAGIASKRVLINTFMEQKIYESTSSITDNIN